MQITPTRPRFSGRSADSSRTVTPEPEDRPSSPDSIHSDPETESQLTLAGNTAKDLLKRGAISKHEYDLMTGGLDRAHLEIRSKIALGRAWQTRSRKLDDDLYETEDQLDVVQRQYETADHNMGIVQAAYQEAVQALDSYKLNNTILVQENARLSHEVVKLSAGQPQPQEERPRSSSKKIPTEPQKTPLHKMTLRQKLLSHQKEQAALAAKMAEGSSPQ